MTSTTTDNPADLDATWDVWGSADPAEDPMPAFSNLTRKDAVRHVDQLHAQGHTNAYAVDTAANDDPGDDDEPDDLGTFYDGPTVTVAGFESLLNLPMVEKFRTGEDGTLIAINYRFDPTYPRMNGAVLDFKLPDGRTVRAQPDADHGLDILSTDDTETNIFGDRIASPARNLTDGAIEVLHLMHDEIDQAFNRLTRQFLTDACTNAAQALAATTGSTR